MHRLQARIWLRLALAVAVAYVLAFQGIATAFARGTAPVRTASHWCGTDPAPGPETPGPQSHLDCCLAGCRHAAGDAPAVAVVTASIAAPRPAPASIVAPPPAAVPFSGIATGVPPVRGPPLR